MFKILCGMILAVAVIKSVVLTALRATTNPYCLLSPTTPTDFNGIKTERA